MKKRFANICRIIFCLLPSVCFLPSCAPQREFVKFGNPCFQPFRGQSSPVSEYDSCEWIGHGVSNSGIPAAYSQRNPAPYGVLVDGPRHSPYLSPQYRTLDLPDPLPAWRLPINRTDAPIIVRDGSPNRYNQIIMEAFH